MFVVCLLYVCYMSLLFVIWKHPSAVPHGLSEPSYAMLWQLRMCLGELRVALGEFGTAPGELRVAPGEPRMALGELRMILGKLSESHTELSMSHKELPGTHTKFSESHTKLFESRTEHSERHRAPYTSGTQDSNCVQVKQIILGLKRRPSRDKKNATPQPPLAPRFQC